MSKSRILIVEDEGIVATDIERQLLALGYEPAGIAVSGEEAVVLAARERPDLVLMDIHLAGEMDGIQAATVIRNTCGIPAVFLTAYASEDVVERAKDASPLGYIIKPFEVAELRTTVEIALHKHLLDARLRASEARFRALFDSVRDAVITVDASGRIVGWSPSATALSGYAPDEAVGRHMDFLLSDEERERVLRELELAFDPSSLVTLPPVREATAVLKSGARLPVEFSFSVWHNAEGSFLTALVRDVSERRRLEAQFLQAQKMEVVGRLAGGVAHDFNNLLTVINGTSDLVLLDIAEDNPIRDDFQQIKDAGERAARLTRQLLAFSRKQLAAPVVLHMGTQVAATAKMLQRLIGEDVHLVVNSDQDQGHVRIDAGYFEQILLNLSVNARDAMPKGGSLVIETRRTHLESALARNRPGVVPGRFVLLSVTDTGTGIAPDVRERIFEPFFTTKAEGNGTGLGLATVQHLVRESGGYITVDSEPGAGARFNVYLPEVSVPLEGADGPPAGPIRGSEVVLIVEDDKVLLEVMTRMLSSAGYTALSASSGSLALELLAANKARVDLLLADVVMPGMAGPELAAEVTRRWPTVKVLFTSGYVGDRISPETLGPNAHFIAKPFTGTALTHKIRETLDGTPVAD